MSGPALPRSCQLSPHLLAFLSDLSGEDSPSRQICPVRPAPPFVSVTGAVTPARLPQICLMSRDMQNVLVATYAELKQCFQRSFHEVFEEALPKDAGAS